MPDLVVGVDAGATTTRCLVADADGSVLGRATGGGANFRSSGECALNRLAEVLAASVSGLDPRRVAGGVIGVAGAGPAGAETVRAAAGRAWTRAQLPGRPRVVTDLDVAFAAGTAAPDGLLLVAGTGAAAAAFVARRAVRRCDGYGWLLGDQGSAVWLGLRGVRAALDAHDGRGPATRLHADLTAHLAVGADADLPQALIAHLHAAAPADLGTLAPLVTRAAQAGDEVAGRLVVAAAERLVAGIRAVAGAQTAGELVLAGGLLAAGPVRDAVVTRLPRGLALRDAGPGAAGAAALALADLGGLNGDRHAALLRSAAG